jgi:predicted Zn finger-like uncharacterized protein
MSTVIDCPSCRRQLRVPPEFLGKSVRCPTCGETFDAAEPAPQAAAPAEAEPVAAAEPSPLVTVPIQLELDDPPAARPAAEEPPKKEAPPPPRREPEKRDDRDDRDRREDRRRMRRRIRRDFEPCPRCDEDVRRGAVVCPFCGLDLEVQGDGYTRQRRVRHDAEPHRGGVIQTLGILSLVSGVIWFLFWIGLPLGIAAWVMGRRDLRKMDEGTMDPSGRKKTRDGRLCGIVGTALNGIFACVGLLVAFLIIMEASRPMPAAPPPPAFQNRPPAWQNNPPGWQNRPGRAQGNRFTLSGPQAVTLKPGETIAVTIHIEPLGGWRGNVHVAPENPEELDGLKVDPAEGQEVPGGQAAVTFKVKADADADLGEQTITFNATTDAGEEVSLDVRVKVERGR